MKTESARLEHASPWSERRDCRPDSWLAGPAIPASGSKLLSPRSLPRIAREQPAKCDFGQPVDETRPPVSSYRFHGLVSARGKGFNEVRFVVPVTQHLADFEYVFLNECRIYIRPRPQGF